MNLVREVGDTDRGWFYICDHISDHTISKLMCCCCAPKILKIKGLETNAVKGNVVGLWHVAAEKLLF